MLDSISRRAAVLVTVASVVAIGASAAMAVHANARGSGAAAQSVHRMAPSPAGPLLATRKVNPAVLATNAHCGQTITASLTLNGDLQCSGNGLTVNGAAAVVLNLNGHQITGGASGSVGVTLTSKSATVENGVIINFTKAVQVVGVLDTVTNIRATLDSNGIVDLGTSTKVTNNVTWRNGSAGIYAGGSGGTFSGNHVLNNTFHGLEIVGSKNVVTSNVANGNTYDGIYDGGYVTTLTKNIANFNGHDGIYLDDLTPIDGGGNTAKGNDFTAGVPAEQCLGIVCT